VKRLVHKVAGVLGAPPSWARIGVGALILMGFFGAYALLGVLDDSVARVVLGVGLLSILLQVIVRVVHGRARPRAKPEG
jgi:predicted Kef-type K+ transport protein